MHSESGLDSVEKHVVKALSLQARIACLVLRYWSTQPAPTPHSVQTLREGSQLGATEDNRIRQILMQLSQVGWAVPAYEAGEGWWRADPFSHSRFDRVALALEGVSVYVSEVHRDKSIADVVLTRPPGPSQLDAQLGQLGWRTHQLQSTQTALFQLASQASNRLVVMTPFLDEAGAAWLKGLYGQANKTVARALVLRRLENPAHQGYPTGYSLIADWLSEQGIQVFNYSLPRAAGSGRESFHAKVVLCDKSAAYVGSANLNEASLAYSMEMGVLVQGAAAEQVALVVDAVLASCSR